MLIALAARALALSARFAVANGDLLVVAHFVDLLAHLDPVAVQSSWR